MFRLAGILVYFSAIVLLAALAFSPVVQKDFVNCDDQVNALDNRAYSGVSWSHLRWMFSRFLNSLYQPLSWISWDRGDS